MHYKNSRAGNRLGILILCLLPWLAAAQHNADSLLQQLALAPEDTGKVWLYCSVGRLMYASETERALGYARAGETLAKKLHFAPGEAKAVNLAGVCQLILSHYDESLVSHFRALELREEIKDSTGTMESLINIGNVYYRLSEPDEAAGYYRRGLALAEKLKSKPGQAMLYNNLGSYYKDKWVKTKSKNDYYQALTYIGKARTAKEAINDQAGMANVVALLGDIYLENGENSKALEAYLSQLAICHKSKNKECIASSLASVAEVHLAAGNLTSAALYADSAYAAALATKSEFMISNASFIVTEVSARRKDYRKAYELVVAENIRNNDIFSKSRQKVREELSVKYQSAKKDELNRQLEQESQSRLAIIIQKNKTQLLAFVTIGVLLILTGIIAWNRQKLKKANRQISWQKEQIELQAKALQAKNEALVTANTIRNKVFSIISHDLRSPLAALDGMLALLKVNGLSREEMTHFADLLSGNMEITRKMLDGLLAWAGAQISGREIKVEALYVAGLVQENYQLFAASAAEKNITLQCSISPDIKVFTDKERLNFIVRNIISNAIKFTCSGGEIIASWQDNTLRIQDTGVGMKSDALGRLFTQRLNSTDGTANEKGSGLGMLLSKDFADSLDLSLTAGSIENMGTSFYIRFPQDQPVPAADAIQVSDSAGGPSGRLQRALSQHVN